MPAGEGGRLFLATRDQNFRVNQYRKKQYAEIEGEHLYRATRHFPEIRCSHGPRCTRCQNNLRRPRKNETVWRQEAHPWPADPATGFVGSGKQRMEATLQEAYGGSARVAAIMTREIPRAKSVSSLRRLKDIASRPVEIDNRLQHSLKTAYEHNREYAQEARQLQRAALTAEPAVKAKERVVVAEFRRQRSMSFFVRNLPQAERFLALGQSGRHELGAVPEE